MFDVHTHNKSKNQVANAIVNCGIGDDFSLYPRFSLGIHPWNVGDGWENDYAVLASTLEALSESGEINRLSAIGEIGLDKVCGVSMEQQLACFEAQLLLASHYGKPVIVHCVKAVDELLAVFARLRFGKPVVFHGFRGKAEQARQLLSKGFYLSFGLRFHAESLRLAYASGRMFLETDDSCMDISEVYASASKALNISATDICVPGIFSSAAI
ncbi:MAG: TatD family hydrolase [Bacteroidaceae bacterium]|nr:TatD family hydrolase [Bacteroidaceae bacterium]